ncbi:MAG: hypothetical protein PHU85_07815 [Phycisphaerae bacterium]|nr:hypothetical protein [Phycisphaerae bacterium]
MEQNRNNQTRSTHLAQLIDEVPDAQVASLWARLDMEHVARRLIQTARIAAAEHALLRAHEAVERRDQARRGGTGRRTA